MNRFNKFLAAAAVCLAFASALAADERISLTMRDVDLAEVMDMLSREQRVNILVSTDSSAAVSFSLYDMTLPDAIRAIANAAGLAVEHYDGSYFIVDRDDAGKYAPDALTRVASFELQYARVNEMESLLRPYLSEYGELTIFSEKNVLMVQDTPQFLARIGSLLGELDKQPTQIMIEAQILEVTLSDEDSYGLDWGKLFRSDGGNGSFGTQGLGTPSSAGLFFDYTSPNVAATLNALRSQGRVRTLSTPKLLALENQESSVIIGDRRGYAVTTTINQVTTESIEFLESGVILRVTPSVDGTGEIMLDIHPEVSTGTIDPNTGIPSQTTTEVSTQMIVADGQTIFVGGLIKHTIDESKQGVPVLGDIPGIGRLFSNRRKTNLNTETVVLITPTIIRDGENDASKALESREEIERLKRKMNLEALNVENDMDFFFDGAPLFR